MEFRWELLKFEKSENEYITCHTIRAKVMGGWIIKSVDRFNNNKENVNYSQSMVFVPDPNHEWHIEE